MSNKPRRSSDEYIHFRKKITSPSLIKIVAILSTEWMIPSCDVLYRFITESAAKEISKKNQIEELKKRL
jgi:hypothetical protein